MQHSQCTLSDGAMCCGRGCGNFMTCATMIDRLFIDCGNHERYSDAPGLPDEHSSDGHNEKNSIFTAVLFIFTLSRSGKSLGSAKVVCLILAN